MSLQIWYGTKWKCYGWRWYMIWNCWKLMMEIEIDMDLFKQVIDFSRSNVNKIGEILAVSSFKYYDLINNEIEITNE